MQRIPSSPAKNVNTRMAGNLKNPRGERRIPTVCESANPTPNANKHFLRHVLGGIRVPQHAIDEIEDRPLVPLEDFGKSRFIAGLRPLNQTSFFGIVEVTGHLIIS